MTPYTSSSTPIEPSWLQAVAAPIWQMLTGIGQLRSGESVRTLGGTPREQAFVREAASLLGARAVIASPEMGEADLVLVLDGSLENLQSTEPVAAFGRLILRAGSIWGSIDAAWIAQRSLTVRGINSTLWAERNPEQLREIVAALEACQASRTGPLVTLNYQSEAQLAEVAPPLGHNN